MKTIKEKWICLLLLFVFFGCTQKKSDNKTTNISNDSLDIYFSLAYDFNLPIEKRLEYISKANEIVVSQENDSLNRANLFKIANRYYNINSFKEYFKTVNLVLENSEIAGDTVNMSRAYGYLGDYYRIKSVSDSSFLFYYKAEQLYVKLENNKMQLVKILINKANLFIIKIYFNSEYKYLRTILSLIDGLDPL